MSYPTASLLIFQGFQILQEMKNEDIITVSLLLNGQLLTDICWRINKLYENALKIQKKKRAATEGTKLTPLLIIMEAIIMHNKTFIGEMSCVNLLNPW